MLPGQPASLQLKSMQFTFSWVKPWGERGFLMLLQFQNQRNQNKENFYSNCLLAKKSWWYRYKFCCIWEYLKQTSHVRHIQSKCHLHYSQIICILISVWVGLFYHFQLYLGMCYCSGSPRSSYCSGSPLTVLSSEFSVFSAGVVVHLFFFVFPFYLDCSFSSE